MTTTISERQRMAALGLALWLFAVPADAQHDMSDWPEWLRTAMLQEAKSKRARKVEFADGASVKLPGRPEEVAVFDGGWTFLSDGDAPGSMICYVFTDEPDLATLAMYLGEDNVELVSKQHGEAANKSLFKLDAGAIEGKPYLALDWFYTVGEVSEAKAALTKVRVAANDGIVQACVHNGLGYRETIERVFRTFVTSLEYPTTATPAYYREVSRMSFGDQPIGVVWLTYTLDADGDTEIYTRNAQLLPAGPDAVSSSDSISLSYSSPDGALINRVSATVENGELTTQLELYRDGEGEWVVTGTYQGKALETALDGEIAPMSELGQQLLVEDLFAGDDDEVVFPIWTPVADPTSFIMTTIHRIDGSGRNNARLNMGPIDMEVEVDTTGSLKGGSMQVGAATVSMERIHVEGEAR